MNGVEVNSEIVIVAIALAIAITVISLIYKSLQNRPRYEKRILFTNAERNFLKVLDHAVGDRYRVFGKVRIADVLEPSRKLSRKSRNSQFWKVSSKHFDYVLCDPATLEVVCVIELNDKSHEAANRRERDIFVNEACKSAQLPIVWIPAKMKYDRKKIRSVVFDHIAEYQ